MFDKFLRKLKLFELKMVFTISFFISFSTSQKCLDKSKAKAIQKGLNTIPVVLVLSALGANVRLPCHYCNEKVGITGRIWRQRSLHGKEVVVRLDMHDDPKRNRVYVTEDHSLVIRRITPKDGAYYFCYDREDLEGGAKMDILLDVEHRTTLEPKVLNASADLKLEVPKWLKLCTSLKQIPALSEYECYADWGRWSKCDNCDTVGERKRVAKCRLQKFVKARTEISPGNVMEADFPVVGVGCHSVLLDEMKAPKRILNKIPNLVLIEKCRIKCAVTRATKKSKLNPFKKSSYMKKLKRKIVKKMKSVSPDIKTEIKSEKEDSRITLFCPGAELDTKVKWKVNGRPLKEDKVKEKTHGRITIDAIDALHINELRVIDSGEYTCFIDGIEVGIIRLKVTSRYTAFDPTSNFGILTLAMTGSFILWMSLMYVKWKNFKMQRKVQQLRNKKVQQAKLNRNSLETESQSLLDIKELSEESSIASSTESS